MHIKNVLIVCWDFPPNNGIGGRRWAKIAKQLVRSGYSVNVICKQFNQGEATSPWLNDVKDLSINIYYLKQALLSNWLGSTNSFKVHFSKTILKILYNGTIYDKALGIKSDFLKLANGLIEKKKIDTVFVTGAPFNLMYYTALIQEKFSNLKVISDYRDPWITAQNYGMKELNTKRLDYERMKQNLVIEKSTIISCPNEYLLDEIRETYTGSKTTYAKFEVLRHFYDNDDKIAQVDSDNNDTIRFIYAGTIYLGCDDHLRKLNEKISNYKETGGKCNFRFEFYVNEIEKANIFKSNADVVIFRKPIGNKIFKEIANAHYVIILLSEHNKNYLTSKFFEYLPYRKPYFYIGPEGHVSNTILTEELGVIAESINNLSELLSRIKEPLSTSVEKHELSIVTNEFLKRLN